MNMSRQLLGLLLLMIGITVLTSVLSMALLLQAGGNAAQITSNALSRLQEAYRLLETLGYKEADLQRLLRIKDPDQLEKILKEMETRQMQVTTLVAVTGESAASIRAKLETLAKTEKLIIDDVLKGNGSAAFERFIETATPQYDALHVEVSHYYNAVAAETSAAMAQQTARNHSTMIWRFGAIGLVLIGFVAYGWTIKHRISSRLSRIANALSETSARVEENAAQVSASSQSLAEGASEQAASLQETSASLEELSSMTRRNSDDAQTAKSLTAQSRQSASDGASDVVEMSAAMQAINDSSGNIARIVKTIDEIAFQTKILALNAAVEAARAGEAGTGFAVVADEVRNLAQRSAMASRETAEKIRDSIEKSGRGATVSGKIAVRLTEIAAETRQVDELIAGIAAASREQRDGISQINSAVTQMDKVTQITAAAAEESAGATLELQNQATAMKDAVEELLSLVGRQAAAPKQTLPLALAMAAAARPNSAAKRIAALAPNRPISAPPPPAKAIEPVVDSEFKSF